MKPVSLSALLIALFFIPCGMGKNVDLAIDQKMTLPQVMEALRRVSSDDSAFKTMTYSLPRIYHAQGAQVASGVYRNLPEAQLRAIVIQGLCSAHRLVFVEKDDNHHHFFRNPAYRVSEPFLISDALASLQKHIKKSGLDLNGWEVVLAELKYDSGPGHDGRYWHFQYLHDVGSDGGVGTHHFFVWSDLLVEHIPDGNRRSIPMIPAAEILQAVTVPAP